jgi:hypothetical protein
VCGRELRKRLMAAPGPNSLPGHDMALQFASDRSSGDTLLAARVHLALGPTGE